MCLFLNFGLIFCASLIEAQILRINHYSIVVENEAKTSPSITGCEGYLI